MILHFSDTLLPATDQEQQSGAEKAEGRGGGLRNDLGDGEALETNQGPRRIQTATGREAGNQRRFAEATHLEPHSLVVTREVHAVDDARPRDNFGLSCAVLGDSRNHPCQVPAGFDDVAHARTEGTDRNLSSDGRERTIGSGRVQLGDEGKNAGAPRFET